LQKKSPFISFVKNVLITVGCVLGFVVGLNLLVDPFAIYGTGILPRAEVNYYQKKLELFENYNPKPECLIIGSSRVFALDPVAVEGLTGLRTFNFAVPGAHTETFYSILRLALEDYNSPIKTLIIGVDPESFHPTIPIQSEARYIGEYAKYFIHDEAGKASVFEKLGLLFSLGQLDESIGSVRNYLKSRAGISKMEYFPNGYSVYVQREQEIADGTFNLQERMDQRVRKYPDRSLFLTEFTGLSDVRKQYWEDMLAICREKGIKVYAFLPPTHPQLYQFLESVGAFDIFGDVSDYLRSSVVGSGGIFRDYTNLESFNGNPDDFYDEIHMRPQNGELLLRDLLGSNGR
jgi:hypothetical protein